MNNMATTGRGSEVPDALPKLDSLPNLRILCKRSAVDSSAVSSTSNAALYRSSKPDRLISEELSNFRKLGIQSIIDFRSKDEYLSSEDSCHLDTEYALYKVLVPSKNYKLGDSVQHEPVMKKAVGSAVPCDVLPKSDRDSNTSNSSEKDHTCKSSDVHENQWEKRHYLINFFTAKYIITIFNRLPWRLWCLGFVHLIWDLLLRNKFQTFRKFFVTKALNSCGIFGQYIDIVELSQPSICSALKLIADPNNLPALINCAHGKDRTGIVSALILTCLGMPKEYVAEEYALSTEGLEPIKHLVYQDIVQKYHFHEEFCRSDADTMRDLLIYIEDRYKSVEDYMVYIGFSLEEQDTLRKTLEAFAHPFSSDANKKSFSSAPNLELSSHTCKRTSQELEECNVTGPEQRSNIDSTGTESWDAVKFT